MVPPGAKLNCCVLVASANCSAGPSPSSGIIIPSMPTATAHRRIMLMCSLSTRSLHHPEEPARQFRDVILSAPPDRFLWHQLTPDAQRRGARPDVIRRRLLIHTAGGDQLD